MVCFIKELCFCLRSGGDCHQLLFLGGSWYNCICLGKGPFLHETLIDLDSVIFGMKLCCYSFFRKHSYIWQWCVLNLSHILNNDCWNSSDMHFMPSGLVNISPGTSLNLNLFTKIIMSLGLFIVMPVHFLV